MNQVGVDDSQGSDVRQVIGCRLVQECERLGITNTRAAEISGCSRRTWSYYLRGTHIPDAEVLSTLDGRGFDVLYIVTGRRMQKRRSAGSKDANRHSLAG
ncbi:TPA: helix-turn-helix domain-containing protein [Pseudomonas putida]